MKKAETLEVAVFPFRNLALFPFATLPMYVFEPSVIQMFKDSIRDGFPVAIGLGDPIINASGYEIPRTLSPKKIMAIGRPTIIEEYDDESVYIEIKGIGRVELHQTIQNSPYVLCSAKALPDQFSQENLLIEAPIERLKSILVTWINRNLSDAKQRNSFFNQFTTPQAIVDYISMFIIQDRDLKQLILETTLLEERIDLLDFLLKNKKTYNSENLYHGSALKHYESLELKAAMEH